MRPWSIEGFSQRSLRSVRASVNRLTGADMLDKPADVGAQAGATGQPARDFQQHLADLEARGLLVRIDRPINKDTELHPLVRWQFLGGVPEDKRRAFLFTHVVDAKGR